VASSSLSWIGIVRLGLVQTSLGAIIVLLTSTLNRVMVVELLLPATIPGILVGIHYAIQLLRPRWGHGSDVGGRRTPWIIGGMAVLAGSAALAAMATALVATNLYAGLALLVVAFLLIGVGVGAAGTSLLALLAERVSQRRKAAAGAIVWIMMIMGFVVTATTAGHFLDPFSLERLVVVTSVVSVIAFGVTVLALYGIEGSALSRSERRTSDAPKMPFREALKEVWAESQARRFTVFVFISMLAYSAQDLILEPFAGIVFGFTPGETTKLSGLQNGGVLLGMILVGVAGGGFGQGSKTTLTRWAMGGCVISACALVTLAVAGIMGPHWPLTPIVFALGFGNGVFAVAAIGSMMSLAGSGTANREGTRVGLWGAAQAIAFAVGGLAGTIAVDLGRWLIGSQAAAYASVFVLEAALFLVAAYLASQIIPGRNEVASPVLENEGALRADAA
jgi:BCD family chlorophyll transporter-like MFS transporter